MATTIHMTNNEIVKPRQREIRGWYVKDIKISRHNICNWKHYKTNNQYTHDYNILKFNSLNICANKIININSVFLLFISSSFFCRFLDLSIFKCMRYDDAIKWQEWIRNGRHWHTREMGRGGEFKKTNIKCEANNWIL